MANEVAVNILLKAQDQSSPAIASATGNLEKLGKAGKVAWGLVGGAAAGTAIGILSDAARAAAEDEANVIKLQKAIENSGASWADNADAVNARIKAGQNLAFTDDQIRDSLSILTAQTGDLSEAMRRQKLAMDLSRGAGIDLQTASKLLGKVTDENVNVLNRYGISVAKGSDETALFAAVQQKFGGQAEAYGATTSASIFKIKDSIDEWKESLGATLGPAQGVIALLPGLRDGAGLVGTALGGLSSLIKLTFIPSLIAMAIPFLPLILVIGAIGIAIGLLALAWSNNWGDIQGKTSAVIGFLQDLFDGFRVIVLLVFKGIVTGVTGFVNGIIGIINGFIDTYNGLAEMLHLPLIGKIELIVPNLEGVDAAINQIARDREARIIVNEYPGSRSATPGHGMYASGTDHITKGPEWFLAGEAGPERVQVTPLAALFGGRPLFGGAALDGGTPHRCELIVSGMAA